MPIVHVDADTYALWWMDESAQATQLIDATGNGSPLNPIAGGYTKIPRVEPGPNGIGTARVCTLAEGTFAQETGTPGAHTGYFTGAGHQYTWSCYLKQRVAATGDVWSYGGPIEGLADSKITFFVTSTGKLGFNFEYAGGTDLTLTQSAGSGVTLNVWSHVAIVVINPDPLGPTPGSVIFYIDGVFQDSASIPAADLHSGGTNARFGLFTNFQTYVPFQGSVKDIKMTNVASLSAYIAADAALMNTTAEQVLDSNTIFLYRLNDAADAVDQCGRVPLVAQDQFAALPTLPLTNDTSLAARSKTFNGSTSASQLVTPVGPNDVNMGLATVFRGTCSIDFWVKVCPESGSNLDHGIILLNAPGVETVDANFFAVGITFDSLVNGYSLTYQWETGSGSDHLYTTPNNTITYVQMQMGRAIHVGIVKTVTGGNLVWKTYINGVLMDTSGSLANYDGTMNTATALFNIGSVYSTGFAGGLDEVRISTIARTGAEFAAIYATATDLAAPVITLVSPTDASTIAKSDVVTVDVTDTGGFSSLLFEVSYGEGLLMREVIHDGDAFSNNFTGGSNTKNTITNGFRFTMLRDGGWPANAVHMKVIVTDATGIQAEATFNWTVTTQAAPVISLVAPTNGSTIAKDDVISIDVIDDAPGLIETVITAVYGGIDRTEVVALNDSFSANFSNGANSMDGLTGGTRYVFRRDNDWPSESLTVVVEAVDAMGNRNGASFSWTVTAQRLPTVGNQVP